MTREDAVASESTAAREGDRGENESADDSDTDEEEETIRLRLGNVIYETQRSVLWQAGGMLRALLTTELVPAEIDADGALILRDRDPYRFGVFLKFLEEYDLLRYIHISSPLACRAAAAFAFGDMSDDGLRRLLNEADYFQCELLGNAIEEELSNRQEYLEKEIAKRIRRETRELVNANLALSGGPKISKGCLVHFETGQVGDRVLCLSPADYKKNICQNCRNNLYPIWTIHSIPNTKFRTACVN